MSSRVGGAVMVAGVIRPSASSVSLRPPSRMLER
jgi:hypothetical protein